MGEREVDAQTQQAPPACPYEEDVSALLCDAAEASESSRDAPPPPSPRPQPPPAPGYVCMAMCSQDTLNAMFEAIRDFVQEVTVTFTEDRVTVVNEDTTGGVVVCISMPADKIRASGGLYEYRCSEPRKRACVDVKRLSSVFKAPVRQGDIAELRLLESEPMLIHVIERNVNTGESKATSVRLIDPNPDADVGYVDSIAYETCVTMESVEFYDSVKKLCTTESTTVRVWCDGAAMAMSACGRFIPCITWTMQLRPAGEVAKELNDAAVAAEALAASRSSHGRSHSHAASSGAHRSTPAAAAAAGQDYSSSSASSSPSSSDAPSPQDVAASSGGGVGASAVATATQTPPRQEPWVTEGALTVDPSASSSLERRFGCVRPGTAIICRKPGMTGPDLDAFYPLSFVMRIAKAKAVSRCVALNLSDTVPVICFSYDTEIGSLRFVLASKDESKATDVDREVASVAPKYVPDALSERVDEACRAKCNMAKRKRTRRVWSRREACAHAQQQLVQQQQRAIQSGAQVGRQQSQPPPPPPRQKQEPAAAAKKRPSSSGRSGESRPDRKRRRKQQQRPNAEPAVKIEEEGGDGATAPSCQQPPYPDATAPLPPLPPLPPSSVEPSERCAQEEAFRRAMAEVSSWMDANGMPSGGCGADGGSPPSPVVVPVPLEEERELFH